MICVVFSFNKVAAGNLQWGVHEELKNMELQKYMFVDVEMLESGE